MTTKAEYVAQARAANPKPQYATINGVQIELTDDEYDAAIEAWALMRWYQDNPDKQPAPLPFGVSA